MLYSFKKETINERCKEDNLLLLKLIWEETGNMQRNMQKSLITACLNAIQFSRHARQLLHETTSLN